MKNKVKLLSLLILVYFVTRTYSKACPRLPPEEPFSPYEIKIFPTSLMCRCFNRPEQDVIVEFQIPPPTFYQLQYVEFDTEFIADNDPRSTSTVCVFFGQVGATAQAQQQLAGHFTHEFIIQALNEYGWPVGWWEIAPFRDTCELPANAGMARISLFAEKYYDESNTCFRDDKDAQEQRWFTQGQVNRNQNPLGVFQNRPRLLQFRNTLTGSHGITALLHLDPNLPKPSKLKFMVETYYQVPAVSQNFISTRIVSETYDVTYPAAANAQITLAAGNPDIVINRDYSYQVSKDICLRKPDPPLPIPHYPENTCRCFINARRNHTGNEERGPGFNFEHIRLDLPENNLEFILHDPNIEQLYPKLHASLLVSNTRIHQGTPVPAITPQLPATNSLLQIYPFVSDGGAVARIVVFYPFLPPHKTREWREREVVLQDIRSDIGHPIGTWLDPHISPDKENYVEYCNLAMRERYNAAGAGGTPGTETYAWVMPPYPAVGKCAQVGQRPVPGQTQPCYFHFNHDWFYVDCVEKCESPKYVCGVWEYNTVTAIHPAPLEPFEFQFIATSVYYHNLRPPQEQFEELQGTNLVSNCEDEPEEPNPTAANRAPRIWNMMETHHLNLGVSHRSDLWKFTGKNPTQNNPNQRPFKRVDASSDDSDSILNPSYYNQTKDMTTEDLCIPPSTYYVETKDTNLCLCTFWGENLVTWQTHYGRKTSCVEKFPEITDPATNTGYKPSFDELFEVTVLRSEAKETEVKVRVGIKKPSYVLVLDQVNFPNGIPFPLVFHAVYLQAMDEFGLPVGSFISGHWSKVAPDPKVDPCQKLYPTSDDTVLKRYPIFTLAQCPWPTFEDEKKRQLDQLMGGLRRRQAGNLFIMKNQWKDKKYDHICATFNFKATDYPEAKKIQFMAFVRLEDYGGVNSYRIELYSEWIPVPFELDPPPATPGGTSTLKDPPQTDLGRQDPLNTKAVLNYEYFHKLQRPTVEHYHRQQCVTIPKDPPRVFELCRHYLTTPDTKAHQRWDLNIIIDEYNQACTQYINAVRRFSLTHPYTVGVKEKLVDAEVARNVARDWKKCFIFKAFKHRQGRSFHVQLRFGLTAPAYCVQLFKADNIKEVAIMALNENGYPIGAPHTYKDPDRERGSFVLFNFHVANQTHYPESCINEDIELSLDDRVYENRMIPFGKYKARCFIPGGSGTYTHEKENYVQDYNSEGNMPSIFVWANFQRDKNGFCVHWNYPLPNLNPPPPANPEPNYLSRTVQFIAELQIIGAPVKNWGPNKKLTLNTEIGNGILVLRTPKYIFGDPGPKDPTFVPGPNAQVDKSLTPDNSCHAEEGEIDENLRPDDECECTLTPRDPNNPVQTPPVTLCQQTYKNYDKRLDSTLYRACLSQEKDVRNRGQIDDKSCPTKINYPTPPEVFPNELIYLRPDGPEPYIPNATLDLIDPTDEAFEGCGYIKDCISRFRNRNIEEECIGNRSCDMIVAFGKALAEAPIGHEAIIEIYAVSRGWAAIGFSDDDRMSEDYVIECTKEGGEVNLYNSWNFKVSNFSQKERFNLRLRGDQRVRKNIRPIKNIFFEDKLYCKFYIEEWFSKIDPEELKERSYDLHTPYHIIMAFANDLPEPYGEATGNIKTHLIDGAASELNRTWKTTIIPSKRYSPLPIQAVFFRLHALLNMFGWFTCLTLSVFVARYFKETLVTTMYFKLKFWYFWHIFGAIIATLCLIFAELFRYWASVKWTNQFKSNFHKYTGWLGIGIFLLTLITGFCSKQQRNMGEKRHIINFIHCLAGHIGYNLVLLNLGLAARVPYGFLACSYTTYIWVWAIIYFGVHGMMTYHYWWIDFIVGRHIKSRRFFAIDVFAEPEDSPGEGEMSGGERTRKSRIIQGKRKSARKSRKSALSRRGTAQPNQVDPEPVTDANVESGPAERPVRYVVREAPGTYIRIFFLVVFTVFVSIYTLWIARKLVNYPTHCYGFEKLKEFESSWLSNLFN